MSEGCHPSGNVKSWLILRGGWKSGKVGHGMFPPLRSADFYSGPGRPPSGKYRAIPSLPQTPPSAAGACRISWLASRVSPGANLTFNCQHYFQHCIQNTKFALSHTFTFTGAPMCHPISGLFPFCTATQWTLYVKLNNEQWTCSHCLLELGGI